MEMEASRVITKQRVTDHGEVYTGAREVNAMLDLVAQESERVDSRFLEPACGNGNFLKAVFERKLAIVEQRYARSQLEFERYSVLAVSSIYGIDILEDNVRQCRQRLLEVFDVGFYARLFKQLCKPHCLAAIRHILDRNIICGDALTLRTIGANSSQIIFSEWSPVSGNLLKRRDFAFQDLMAHSRMRELPLFSDLGESVFIPTPLKEYVPVHFLELADDRRTQL